MAASTIDGLIRADGIDIPTLLKAILSLMPLDSAVKQPAGARPHRRRFMRECGSASACSWRLVTLVPLSCVCSAVAAVRPPVGMRACERESMLTLV